MDEDRMASLVEAYGPERILINSAADWGHSDPLKVPKTLERMRGRGLSEHDIETVVWTNPIAFFAQSGKLQPGELDARGSDGAPSEASATYAGNSLLRGPRAS
jgi:hypothetical protein